MPYSGKLRIDTIIMPTGAIVGMTHFPGRSHIDSQGHNWSRDIRADLLDISNWGANSLVTLNQGREFDILGVPNFENLVSEMNYNWFQLPIPDMEAPGTSFFNHWNKVGASIVKKLSSGKKIVFHCAGGLGRTGTIVANLLVEFGYSPNKAVNVVRKARPGAIETKEQESYVYSSSRLT